MFTAIAALLGPLIPVLVQIIFAYLKNKGIKKENARKFIEAVQSVDALKSVKLKDSFDSMDDEFDRRDEEDSL